MRACVRKLLHGTLAVALLLSLTGCWSGVELNRRAFARVMLIDKGEHGLELTLGFPLPNRMTSGKGTGGSDMSGGQPFTFITKSGDSLIEAYRRIQADMSRRITFGQLRSIVIGQAFAKEGIEPLLDFAARETRLHINASLYATEGDAKAFTTIPVTTERFPTDILANFVKEHVTITATVKDMLTAMLSGGDLLLPTLVFGNQGAAQEKRAAQWMSTNGSMLLRKGRMAGSLSTEESKGAMWILGQLKELEYVAPSPEDGKMVSYLVRHSKTKIEPKWDGTRLVIAIRCSAVATVLATDSDMDLTDPAKLASLKLPLETKLEEQLTKAVERAKKHKTEPYKFSQHIQWTYPKLWAGLQPDWRDYFAERTEVRSEFDVSIKWYGAAQGPEWNRRFHQEEESGS
ncbi:hypothetical protein J31TS4_37740 [Paenibacillus sp. J31TS4]|uniref:Ger(x)C family spore germination protein n=1 Tax=Paenibacillus sp. J31TS4 TaxID=2807195 RepID=UPI001B1092CA|nr:Ger(x)C family spore germination protein [Paenibacillus sp. J31TS4]GIP40494.1 hypothetical protein J31TS4_37740 [Paenibacillus sp. J31TS4]